MNRILSLLFAALAATSHAYAQQETVTFSVDASDIQDGYVVKKIWGQAPATSSLTTLYQTYQQITALPSGVDSAKIAVAQPDFLPGMERKRPFFLVRIPAFQYKQGAWKQVTSFELSYMPTLPEQGTGHSPEARTTSSSSVLSTGNWYKISVTERGVYRIDYNYLKNTLGINPDQINPAMIRVFGNGGTMLYESNAVARPDDLVENAIQVVDGGDGSFNPGDYFLFYANGPLEWVKDSVGKRFVHRNNLYEDRSCYFLNFDGGMGRRIVPTSAVGAANISVSSYNDFQLHENDEVNPGKFGKEWWGDEMGLDAGRIQTRTISFPVGTLVDNARISMQLGSRSLSGDNQFSVTMNGQLLGNYLLAAVGGTESDNPLTVVSANFNVPVQQTATFSIKYTPTNSSGRGYINYIELNTRRALAMSNGQFTFRDWNSVGAGNIASFDITGANANTIVWDITNPLLPALMTGSISGTTYTFRQDASRLHEFVAFDGSSFKTPSFIGNVPNQNLHGAEPVDYLIVTHQDFIDAANKLADFHRAKRNLRVLVTTTDKIYNEFSSGGQDISAIRDFARMFYQRAGTDTTNMPRYLLLLGDASYDYKNRIQGNSNHVPTFETAESLFPLSGFCTDDFFAFLDDNENIESTSVANTMDVGVGRLPVRTAEEAMQVVNKIIGYAGASSLGPWRVSTTIVADDYDNAGNHMSDGEVMAGVINSFSDLYTHTKVYLDAIDKVSTPAGARAPNANKIINDQMFRGTFLMNYSGHGSGQTLAHERILSQDDFSTWKNLTHLPIMVTATCEFSRYDNPEFIAAGEKLILKPDGGAVALLTTTQLVFSSLNLQMNQNFLRAMFRQYNGEWPALGDAFRYGKNVTYAVPGSYDNFRKFALLGDPALVPAFPKHQVHTDSVLDGITLLPADTLKALGRYQIKGSVTDVNGNNLSGFNGRLFVTIYDKPGLVSTRPPQTIRTYQTQNNVIYKGRVSVENGKFSFTFIAPKDINYDYGTGKISYYAENGEVDAAGADTGIVIGGFSDNPIADNDPPIVIPYIGDSLFVDGGLTGTNTMLFIKLMDESGINVSGNSVGHDLTAFLDEDVTRPYILNDYYETAPNDYTRGYVLFPINALPDGKHSLRVRAWDINNNSGEGIVNFEVVNRQLMAVRNLMNYPNPFNDYTHICFEHNQPGEEIDVEVNFYSTAGALVHTIRQHITASTGSRINEIIWDGRNKQGGAIESGLYLYRLVVTNSQGNKATGYQKLIFQR